MIDREHERLLQDVLGGTASPRDVERLEAWLATSAEGRQRRQELQALLAALDAVPRVEPPPALRESVLRAIRAGGVRPPVRSRALPTPAWLLVPAAAAALAAAIAFPLWRHALRPEALPDVSGSLVAPARARTATAVLAIGGTHLTLVRTDAAGATQVAVTLGGTPHASIVLAADPATLARVRISGLPAAAVRQGAGRLEIDPGGPASFVIGFRPALGSDEAVRMIVYSGGGRVEGRLPGPRVEP